MIRFVLALKRFLIANGYSVVCSVCDDGQSWQKPYMHGPIPYEFLNVFIRDRQIIKYRTIDRYGNVVHMHGQIARISIQGNEIVVHLVWPNEFNIRHKEFMLPSDPELLQKILNLLKLWSVWVLSEYNRRCSDTANNSTTCG